MTDRKIVLTTERTVLREFTEEDLEDLVVLYSDPEVMRHIFTGVRTRETTREGLDKYLAVYRTEKHGLWAVERKETGEFIGRAGLIKWDRPDIQGIEVGYMLHKAWWRQGLATEVAAGLVILAFERLDVDRIICCVAPENVGSRRVAEKVGFTLDRTVVEERGTILVHAMTRQEFEAASSG